MINGDPDLEEDDNTIFCAIILAKLSSTTHNNVVTSANKDNAQELWKAIAKRFVSSEPSCGGLQPIRQHNLRRHQHRKKISLDNIKQSITHSRNGEEIKPDSLLNHLEIHINELKVSSAGSKQEATTMYTKEDRLCSPRKHNPLASHSRERCWFDANKSQAPWAKKQQEANTKTKEV
ncbi:hypothetical protein VP01_4282g4 [Puccinia sorghi]|uniref:Uncharacterized protein n=1 Tax=Puccinia sorghi TaxID=27349 RepID=A0A0L6UQ75_9BASI|nr:hypothetical protein VP01_4282g4 [Puccinia sorghi]